MGLGLQKPWRTLIERHSKQTDTERERERESIKKREYQKERVSKRESIIKEREWETLSPLL
jgi:hypothetical protein